jgi:DNA modification methylase
MFNLMLGDCLERLKELPDNSVDSVVTDPPYGLSFMGKKWDYDVPSVEIWAECLRVLKPGGHLLAFAGTRTQHRMAVRIEDAGFEIRDMIAWVYGSGFPKSLDISKAIDKAAGVEREVLGTVDPRGTFDGRERNSAAINKNWRNAEGRDDVRDLNKKDITAPATEAAQQWQGWGTALKPALEPITVARKPLIGTVAENVLAYGTGGLNIDGCRVATEDKLSGGHASGGQQMTGGWERPWMKDPDAVAANAERSRQSVAKAEELGRWPANLIHDGSDEVVGLFPTTTSGAMKSGTQRAAQDQPGSVCYGTFGGNATTKPIEASSGSAARFFYCAKASKRDRDEGLEWFEEKAVAQKYGLKTSVDGREGRSEGNRMNTARANSHPTVKPTDLMRYLCRLVTPPGGVVLDPFMGSGSTGKAAMLEGFQFIGIERDPEYMEIARARIHAALQLPDWMK